MSKLKRHHINEVMDMHNLTKGKMGYSIVYYADDVDKVITEKDKELCRHKYKRCLAMAVLCHERSLWWYSKGYGFEKYDKFWEKWEKRWQELAEKLKESK